MSTLDARTATTTLAEALPTPDEMTCRRLLALMRPHGGAHA